MADRPRWKLEAGDLIGGEDRILLIMWSAEDPDTLVLPELMLPFFAPYMEDEEDEDESD